MRVGLNSIVVVCDPERLNEFRDRAVDPLDLSTPVVFAASGRTRQESVASGLALVPSDAEIVLVHDGARPLLRPETATGALEMLEARLRIDGVVVGHPSVDTLKVVEDGYIVDTPDRSRMWAVQTPQVFRADALRSAHESARRDGYLGTDDAALVERNGGAVMVFEGPRDNIKITVPEDHAFAEAVLAAPPGVGVAMRIGIGYDVHAFGRGPCSGARRCAHRHTSADWPGTRTPTCSPTRSWTH